MSFRFYKRIAILPGVTLNLSAGGISLSFGIRGAHITLSASGVRKTVGIPGTGAYHTTHTGWAELWAQWRNKPTHTGSKE